MKSQSKQFKLLAKILRADGFKVATKFHQKGCKTPYWGGSITEKSIRGCFCEPNDDDSYWYVNGRIAFDHEKCFDKWSKCPYSLELPQKGQDYVYVLDRMRYLATAEGFKKSNEFDLWVKDYPFSTHVLCPKCNGMKKVAGKRTIKLDVGYNIPTMMVR